MKSIIISLALFFAACSFGLQQAAAQVAPAPAPASPAPATPPPASFVAHNMAVQSARATLPGAHQPARSQANLAPQQPEQTKVIRIYCGAGYFDDALAEKLRPVLAKTFGSASDAPKEVPGAAVGAPAKPESQKKAVEAAHL